jgi:hypothetical protein
MKNFGDYIYIIVMIIAVVASLIKSNKSRQRPVSSNETDDNDNELPTLADWLNEVREENTESIPQEAESSGADIPKPKTAPFIRSDYFTYDAPDQAKAERTIPTHQMELEVEDEGRFAIDPNLDIREAIIYAEILKRPQY